MSIFGEFCMSRELQALSLSVFLTHTQMGARARSNTLHSKRVNKQTNTRAASERMDEQAYAWMEEERNEANIDDDDDYDNNNNYNEHDDDGGYDDDTTAQSRDIAFFENVQSLMRR